MFECVSQVHRRLDFGSRNTSLGLELPFEVMCDTSDYTLRAILGQRKDNKPYEIYYPSQTLGEAEVNYTTIEKEFLAVVFIVEKF